MNKTILSAVIVLLAGVILISCSSGTKENKGGLNDLKAKLEKLKKEKTKLDGEIKNLEEKILQADPKAASAVKKLVAVDTIRIQDFSHYIDLQGKISSSGIGYVAPKGQGGLVRAVYVKVGQKVGPGAAGSKTGRCIAKTSVECCSTANRAVKSEACTGTNNL
ncbi:MAG: hypothetical protein IPM85_01240 [Chitinophagaceae bacterium]|nr:hypothetical protein [Chitinophagaceae bacterium]